MTATRHHTTPLVTIEIYYLDHWDDGFGLPDGQTVRLWQAYCPLTNRPVGPRGGDFNPAYVRLWMHEKYPAAVECEIVKIATVEA